MKTINVRDLNLDNTGKNLITNDIKKIIEDNYDEELTIIFPKGIYKLSTIHLKSNLNIVIEKDALILGADSFYDYDMQEKIDYPLYQDQSHSYFDCSLFVGRNVENIVFTGGGTIDMNSVWDLDNVRDIVHRGPKCIALKECKNIVINRLTLLNATDLCAYYAGCENVICSNLNLRVYIDGISPDNSKNCIIKNCNIEAGDDGIVFKSSYTLNRLDTCEDIIVSNCNIKSRCNCIKFGTESNGGFNNIFIKNIKMKDTRITGISIESVDGANIHDIYIKNVKMDNVCAPLFIHLGKRLRGPEGTDIGSIKDIFIKNIKAKGPYHDYDIIPWNYVTYAKGDTHQYPWFFNYNGEENPLSYKDTDWQYTSNICGLSNKHIENIYLKKINFKLEGGCKKWNEDVPIEPKEYPEVYTYGEILPAKGIFFRDIDNLSLRKIKISTYKEDLRPDVKLINVTKGVN